MQERSQSEGGEERLVWDQANSQLVPIRCATAAPRRFLKGPVPWSWIEVAAALPGKALEVGLCLWRLAGAMKSTTIRLGNREVERLGIDRFAKSRALVALQNANLIRKVSRPGRAPLITIVTTDRGYGGHRGIRPTYPPNSLL